MCVRVHVPADFLGGSLGEEGLLLGNLGSLSELVLELLESLLVICRFVSLTLSHCVDFLCDGDKVLRIKIEIFIQLTMGVLVFEGLAPARVNLDLGHASP